MDAVNSETVDVLSQMVSGDVVIVDVLIYWVISVVIIACVDFYAKFKLGKKTVAYLSMRIPKFITMMVTSLISVAVVVYTNKFDVKLETLSYLGVPYLGMWFFYLVIVFRRIRAEK